MRATTLARLIGTIATIVGVLASIVRTAQCEREHFVVSDSWRDPAITRTPVEGALHDGWPIDYGAATRKAPQDFSGARVQRVHLPGIRAGIHDAVGNADRPQVNGAGGGVCGLPKDL